MKTKIRFWMPAILFALSSAFLTNCKEDATIPVVSTNEVTAVTDTTATSGGVISSDGGANVTARGVCWSTSQNPTIADNKTTDGTGTGSFTSAITGLTANTTYYVRAYATNSAGTGYGSEMSFTTLEGKYGTMTDIDGNTYKTVKIGTQTWMAENLKVTKYNDGTSIPIVSDSAAWSVLTTGAYCNYENEQCSVAIYGRLYNW
ncbi:MAG: FISUMP domain-containing protein, partial [Bacteroidales bacterium]|nr:FISUMP domain-containing protein [Bacteroidales bacterium]